MGLVVVVIGVLTNDDNLHVVEGCVTGPKRWLAMEKKYVTCQMWSPYQE